MPSVSMLRFVVCILTPCMGFPSKQQLSCVAQVNVEWIILDQLMFPLLMAVRRCTDSFLGVPTFTFSFSSSFWAFFFSSSICLQFSSCARTNILTKLSRVDTTKGQYQIKEKIENENPLKGKGKYQANKLTRSENVKHG